MNLKETTTSTQQLMDDHMLEFLKLDKKVFVYTFPEYLEQVFTRSTFMLQSMPSFTSTSAMGQVITSLEETLRLP
jgi:hypothetical protein